MKQNNHWVFVVGWLTMGGAERQALRFAETLLAHGDRVTFIGLSCPGLVQEECARLGVACHYWPMTLSGRGWKTIRELGTFLWRIRRLQPTYLAPYTILPNMVCGLMWRLSGAKACVWQQRDEGRLRQPGYLESLSVRLTPFFISNSEHAREWLLRTLNVEKNKTASIMNGIQLPAVDISNRGTWRHRNGISCDRLVVTMVANLHSYKDHRTLIRAWALVMGGFDVVNRPLLVLAGRHENCHPLIMELVDELDLENAVLCPGVVRDVPELLLDTDLVAFSSLTEGCPNGVLEGMAAGKAVVGTDIPAIREAVGPAAVKYLSPPGNADLMAEHLLILLLDKKLRDEIGKENRQRIEESFSVQRMVEKTRTVFQTVAESR